MSWWNLYCHKKQQQAVILVFALLFSFGHPRRRGMRLLRAAVAPLQHTCLGDAWYLGGCLQWFLVRLCSERRYDRLPVFLCRYLSAVFFTKGYTGLSVLFLLDLLRFFFLNFFTRSSFTSEGLEEWEDMFKAGCGTSSKTGPTGSCVSVPVCSEL